MRYLFLFALLATLSGCWKYSISNLGKYPTEVEQYGKWQKSKEKFAVVDVKKALLECGSPAPNPSDAEFKATGYVSFNEQLNQGFLVYKCMEAAGYIDTGRYTVKDYCLWEKYKTYPACQPNTVIPSPSVERRLNSWYCKVKTDYNYCLEYSLAPQLCSLEKTKTPPLECLSPEDEKSRGVQATQSLPQTKAASSSSRFRELFFPSPQPMSPESQKHLERELANQKLQQNVQQQNNHQMNSMLKNTAPKRR